MSPDGTDKDEQAHGARRALLAELEWLHLALVRLERVAWEQAREVHNPQQLSGLRAAIQFKEWLTRYLVDARRLVEAEDRAALVMLAGDREAVRHALELALQAVVDARLFSELSMMRAHLPGYFEREGAVLYRRLASA